MMDKTKNFWSSLPGILTGFAAIITAVTGLFIAISTTGTSEKPELENKEVVEPGILSEAAPIDEVSANDSSYVKGLTSAEIANLEKTATKAYNKLPPSGLKTLVDCQFFPTVNSVKSLISWSNYYQKIIVSKNDDAEIISACNKAIDYRGMAHCKVPNDLNIRQALYETLMLCKIEGIEWNEIKHSLKGQ